MNIFQRLIKNLMPDQAFRSAQYLQSLYSHLTFGVSSLTYQNFNQLIKEGYQTNVDVYSVINWISEQAAEIPIIVEEYKNGGWEANPIHPLQKLIDHPNPYQSGQEFRIQSFGFYNTTGNSFIYAPRLESGVNQGQALEMWIMPTQFTEIISGGWMNPITGYRVNYNYNRSRDLPFNDVMHIRTANLEYGEGREFYGMSPLRAGLLALDRSNSNYRAASTMYKTMGMAGIVSEEQPEFSGALTQEQTDEAERKWQDEYNGVFNYGKTMVTNAKVSYTKLGLSAVDMNLLMDKRATLRDICSLFKIDSKIFNDPEGTTYNNQTEAKKSAYNDAVIPLVKRFVTELNNWIVSSYGSNVRVSYDVSSIPVLQVDKKIQAEWVSMMLDRGVFSRDQALKEMGYAETGDDEMQLRTIPMNLIPLDAVEFDPMIESDEAAKYLGKHYLEK